jgi:hypothetical protein
VAAAEALAVPAQGLQELAELVAAATEDRAAVGNKRAHRTPAAVAVVAVVSPAATVVLALS